MDTATRNGNAILPFRVWLKVASTSSAMREEALGLMAVIFHRFGGPLGRPSNNGPAGSDQLSFGQKIVVITGLSVLAWTCIIAAAALVLGT